MGRGVERRGTGRAREIPALLFAVLWILGFEVGPALHLVQHDALEAHDHSDPRAHDEGDAPAPDHGDGSIEHHGLAALTPPPVIAPVVPVLVAEILLVSIDAGRVERGVVLLPPARGPPSST